MLDCQAFLDLLKAEAVTFSTGVPDSLLKNICACIADQGSDIIAANEGAAIAIAAGYHLATGEVPLVYMQNSGFGNTINPLTSLADREVYAIPMLLMVGWRGEPGVKDEPQHVKMGRINEDLINALTLPYEILDVNKERSENQVKQLIAIARELSTPVVLLVREGTFASYKSAKLQRQHEEFDWTREDAIIHIMKKMEQHAVLVSTTGKTSREVFEYRAQTAQGHHRDFLTVGCMGHASQVALGIALQKPNTPIYCLDGDGAVLMHMGSLAIIGDLSPLNFRHVVINNGSHDSVGGQPTVGHSINLGKIAEGCGYRGYFQVTKSEDFEDAWQKFVQERGPVLLEIKIRKGARENLGRPTKSPIENKTDLIEYLQKCQ